MTAYVVAQLTITDRAAYRRYQGAFPAIDLRGDLREPSASAPDS
jgi:uncharacterized protein (DUF1330 family)